MQVSHICLVGIFYLCCARCCEMFMRQIAIFLSQSRLQVVDVTTGAAVGSNERGELCMSYRTVSSTGGGRYNGGSGGIERER